MEQFLVLAETAQTTDQSVGVAGGIISTIVYMGIFMIILYLFVVRPQRKREKAFRDMQDSVKIGDTIMTTGGIFGKVVDIVNDICVVELGLNKGVKVPVQKNYIAAIKEPDMTVKKEEEETDKKEEKPSKK
ncbi:preprotein translocase subunit YajC [Defluviitalea phaphyphila]|uniref:preprotein translocase subunit YajC n=1 Tax=Defluviitalea phaphyphila TaxID=1473580 RepID=UPI00072FE3C8|nr:preprotein translocase subunit YajC [Defluviitalea phaphyphila]